MIITFYIIGFIITYVIIKFKLRNEYDNEWIDIVLAAIISLTSWIGVAGYLFYIFREYIINNKPPKWL
jgi:hypothetical protein